MKLKAVRLKLTLVRGGRTTLESSKRTAKKSLRSSARLISESPKQFTAQYINTFSAANWKALPVSEKKQHTLSNCGGCQVYYFGIHTLFPNGDTVKPRKMVQDIVGKSGLKAQSELKPN